VKAKKRKSTRTKNEVQAALGLREPPSDKLMSLIAEAGDGEQVQGPIPGPESRSYTPADIEDAVIAGTIGALMSRMRREVGQSLREAARVAEMSAARIQQMEHSENIEIATLVRLAAAAGYRVSITLEPLCRGTRSLSAVLAGAEERG
jgi:hypothetical protein